jgi:peroxiredoxin
MELVQLREKADIFKAMGVRVLAVSTDSPEDARRMQETCGAATFTFVSDPEGKTLDVLGIRHVRGNPRDGRDIAQSATVIVDKAGTIRWMAIAETYRVRPDPDVVAIEAAKVATSGS